jgi:hypothetical protein
MEMNSYLKEKKNEWKYLLLGLEHQEFVKYLELQKNLLHVR